MISRNFSQLRNPRQFSPIQQWTCAGSRLYRPLLRCVASQKGSQAAESGRAHSPLQAASFVAATCGAILLSSAAAEPASAVDWTGALSSSAAKHHELQQLQQQATLPAAPGLLSTDPRQQPWSSHQQKQQQQQPPAANEMLQLAAVGEPRPKMHWLLHVLWIGVLNMAGLWAVLKVLAWSKDVSTPVTVLRIHAGLRVDGQQLQERLQFLRSTMMPVEHGMFFTFEEVMQAILRPPRGTSLAYADLSVAPLRSKHDGYDLFKRFAAVEQDAAEAEEARHVQHGTKPPGVQHRNPLQRLLGAAETQDVEESQACVVVTLVLLARGTVSIPEGAMRDLQAFKSSMKQLSSHLSTGQLLAVELLMTPDDPQDFLSEAQLMEDYPFMTDLATGLTITSGSSRRPQQQQPPLSGGGGIGGDAAAAAPAAAASGGVIPGGGSSSSGGGGGDAAASVAAADGRLGDGVAAVAEEAAAAAAAAAASAAGNR